MDSGIYVINFSNSNLSFVKQKMTIARTTYSNSWGLANCRTSDKILTSVAPMKSGQNIMNKRHTMEGGCGWFFSLSDFFMGMFDSIAPYLDDFFFEESPRSNGVKSLVSCFAQHLLKSEFALVVFCSNDNKDMISQPMVLLVAPLIALFQSTSHNGTRCFDSHSTSKLNKSSASSGFLIPVAGIRLNHHKV